MRELTGGDVDWAVRILSRRREALARHAPLYWRPAADAAARHRDFLTYLLDGGGGFGWRTDTGLLIAAPGRAGLTIDDAWVPDESWATDGRQLWQALADRAPGENARFVCPVPEAARRDFALGEGLGLLESWWHVEVSTWSSPAADAEPAVEGAVAHVVPAPPVYDPGGPILFLAEVKSPARALPAAHGQARDLGCPLVVVNQGRHDDVLGSALSSSGYRRHCDFFTGTLSGGSPAP